ERRPEIFVSGPVQSSVAGQEVIGRLIQAKRRKVTKIIIVGNSTDIVRRSEPAAQIMHMASHEQPALLIGVFVIGQIRALYYPAVAVAQIAELSTQLQPALA